MPAANKPAKLTVEFDDRALLRAIKIAAIEQDRTVKDVVMQALRDWLRRKENEEDRAAMAEAEAEGGEDIPWEQAKAELDALEAADAERRRDR